MESDVHIIYFESKEHRARLSIKMSSINIFLDLMLENSDLKIITMEDYYKELPSVEEILCKDIKSSGRVLGRCEEYCII